MQSVYRIEHEDSGIGFYNHGPVQSEEMGRQLFDEMRHPMAFADSKLCRDADANEHELLLVWRYGFASIAQLRMWVYDDSWLEALHEDGFILREYRCEPDACLIGSTQVMFDKEVATEVAEHSLIDLVQE